MSSDPFIERAAPKDRPDEHDGEADLTLTPLVKALLGQQRDLTAVERFTQQHPADRTPALASHYRDLIPLTAPRPGEQFAFEVDLDRCSGCKGCVTACHSLNGLDGEESWRTVGFLVGEKVVPVSPAGRGGNRVIPLQQTVTTACHHCVEPACLLGCPVLAYDKDPLTGIVRHLDDQCIGCSYCIMKCPYEVPQYSKSRGIVRKCDLCHGRLAEGEAPACVQSCPNEAIRITLVRPEEVRKRFRTEDQTAESGWLPDAPDPVRSLPTTRYRTQQPQENLRAADHGQPQPAPPHIPLVLMLVLTQAGLGGLVASATVAGIGPMVGETFLRSALGLAILSFMLLNAGLAASVFHLGQPRKAWRVWLGWRTSWLSREAIALNAAAGVSGLAVLILGITSRWVPPALVGPLTPLRHELMSLPGLLLPVFLAVSALMAIAAQIMVYADTGRAFWSIRWTAPRFFGTAMLIGLAMAWILRPQWEIGAWLGLATALKLASEIAVLKQGDSDAERWTPLRRTAFLQRGPLRGVLSVRLLLALIGGGAIPFAVSVGAIPAGWAWAVIPLLLLGEIAERLLFFTTVAPDKMPGLP